MKINDEVYDIIVPILFIMIPTIISLLFFYNYDDTDKINISSLSWEEITNKLQELTKYINDISNNIHKYKSKDLRKKLKNIKTHIILLKIKFFSIKSLIIENPEKSKEYPHLDNNIAELEDISKIYKNINIYNENISQNNFIDNFPNIIQIIFIPLGVLVGYFGMNFQSMGVPSLKRGTYTFKHGQKYLLGLSLFMVLNFTAILYKYYY